MLKRKLITLFLLTTVSNFSESSELNSKWLTSTPQGSIEHRLAEIVSDFKITSTGILNSETSARLELVKVEGFNYGIDLGVYERSKEIQSIYEKYSFQLTQRFNFTQFIMNGNVLLPKATVSNVSFEQISKKSARRVKASIRLKSTASIVSSAPSWMDYLIRYFSKTEELHEAAKPKNDLELAYFKKGFIDGWSLGVKQAELIAEDDWNRLMVDYSGHYEFLILAEQDIITYPRMDKGEISTYLVDNGQTLYVGDTVAEITLESSFNDIELWTPYFTLNKGVE